MDDTAVICGIEVAFGRRTRDEVATLTFEYLDGIRSNGHGSGDGEAETEREEAAIAVD